MIEVANIGTMKRFC